MINESITVHDQHQFEIKLGYRLHKESTVTAYGLDAYLYLPYSLGVNRATYSKTQFYNDIQAYIRLKSPELPLGRIVSGAGAPAASLKTAVEALAAGATGESAAASEAEIMIFGCIVKSALRDYVAFLRQAQIEGDRRRLADQYLQYASEILAAYRNLRPVLQIPTVSERQFGVYLFGDEYLSLLFEDYSYLMLETVLTEDDTSFKDLRRRLILFIDSELAYRKQHNYPSIPDEKSDNEQLLFRKSVLKKYIGRVLFLTTRSEPEGALIEQVLFGIAAGIAMLFATAVAFYTQSIFGSLTLPFFVALVVSYVFKDRLKDFLRLYLSKRLTSRFFDHHMRIHTSDRKKVGSCRESFEFVEEPRVPVEVRQMRRRDHITEIENGWMGEKVILYRKRIRLRTRLIRQTFMQHEIEGINDIMRFSVLEFIRKMDNPKKQLYVLDAEDYQRVKGDRVYHLNLILKYMLPSRLVYKRFRIVLNRKQIKRIEPVTVREVPLQST